MNRKRKSRSRDLLCDVSSPRAHLKGGLLSHSLSTSSPSSAGRRTHIHTLTHSNIVKMSDAIDPPAKKKVDSHLFLHRRCRLLVPLFLFSWVCPKGVLVSFSLWRRRERERGSRREHRERSTFHRGERIQSRDNKSRWKRNIDGMMMAV